MIQHWGGLTGTCIVYAIDSECLFTKFLRFIHHSLILMILFKHWQDIPCNSDFRWNLFVHVYIYIFKYVQLSICIRMRDLMADQSGIQIWALGTPAYKFNRMRDIMMDHAHRAINMCPLNDRILLSDILPIYLMLAIKLVWVSYSWP